MKYRDTYRIVTQVSQYVSHRDFRYRATPSDDALGLDEPMEATDMPSMSFYFAFVCKLILHYAYLAFISITLYPACFAMI